MATACIVAVAGCATKPSNEQPLAYASKPAPTSFSQAPSDRGLAVQASAFETFMRHARAIEPSFSGPTDVAQALETGASHEPHELEGGMIAFVAMVALQEPRFVAAVRADQSHGELARRLSEDPQAALALPGSEAASARASGALYAEGSALSGEGLRVKQAAYSVQRQAWARANVADAPGRLSRVKRLSATAYRPSGGDAEQLRGELAKSTYRAGPASPVVSRGLALAALTVLGQQGRGRALMSEPRTDSCLHMAKLNLYQCLASAGPHYEDIYCLGQHAMIDPGQCVVDATHRHVQRVAMTKTGAPR